MSDEKKKEQRGELTVEIFETLEDGLEIGWGEGPCKGCEAKTEGDYETGNENDWWCSECWPYEEKRRLKEENARLKEAIYGPRDMTKGESLEHFALRMRQEKEHYEKRCHELKQELKAAQDGLQWYREANTQALRWYSGTDTGISSETIFEIMTGIPVKRRDIPHDPSDFGRCYRLLKIFPQWKERLPEVAEKYPEWKPLVDNWDRLESLYVSKDETMYDYMRELMGR